MFMINEEDENILRNQKIVVKLTINKFNYESMKGITKELGTQLHKVMEASISYFLEHYWENSLDRRFNELHELNFSKEFFLDYCKWLIDHDEGLYKYALNARKRKWYHENKVEVNERKRNNPKTSEYNKEYCHRPEVIEKKRIKQYREYQKDPEKGARERRERG